MIEYHKIQTVYKRDSKQKNNPLLIGEFSLPEFAYLRNNQWVFTEKVDGTNIRVMFDGASIVFGGKTDNAQTPKSLLDRLEARFSPLLSRFKEMFGDEKVCLYGEGYGAKIQKGGGKYRSDPDIVLFDVKIGEWWLQRKDVEDIAAKLGIDIVPIIGHGTLDEMVKTAQEGFYSRWGDFIAEGIVARPEIELRARNGSRIIAKIKHRDFESLLHRVD